LFIAWSVPVCWLYSALNLKKNINYFLMGVPLSVLFLEKSFGKPDGLFASESRCCVGAIRGFGLLK
jgi:hypothetical protein